MFMLTMHGCDDYSDSEWQSVIVVSADKKKLEDFFVCLNSDRKKYIAEANNFGKQLEDHIAQWEEANPEPEIIRIKDLSKPEPPKLPSWFNSLSNEERKNSEVLVDYKRRVLDYKEAKATYARRNAIHLAVGRIDHDLWLDKREAEIDSFKKNYPSHPSPCHCQKMTRDILRADRFEITEVDEV